MFDNTGRKCEVCGQGYYMERSSQDDFSGAVHCNKCGHKEERWIEELGILQSNKEKRIVRRRVR